MSMNSEELLATIAASLQEWNQSAKDLKKQLANLQRGQDDLRSRLNELQPSDEWQWLSDCYDRYHKSQEAARQALRACHYKSVTEYVLVNRRYNLNVVAIDARLARKQSRRAVA